MRYAVVFLLIIVTAICMARLLMPICWQGYLLNYKVATASLALTQEPETAESAGQKTDDDTDNLSGFEITDRPIRPARSFSASAEELAAHHARWIKCATLSGGRIVAPEAKKAGIAFSWLKYSLAFFGRTTAASAGPYFADKGQGNLSGSD